MRATESTRPLRFDVIYPLSGFIFAFALLACSHKDDSPSAMPQTKDVLVSASTQECQTFVSRLQADSIKVPGLFYDYLTVPEEPGNPQSPAIHIFYYGRKVSGQTPVAFFNGGPAESSHGSYSLLTVRQNADPAWAQIPFIFIDQRGTGCSDPYPQGYTDDTLQRLTQYGSRGIVADAELIRQQLGFDKWKVFGQSYGAFVVHRYMVLAGQSIKAAYAHADALTSDPMQRLTGRILSQNHVIEDYLADYPSDRAVLQALDTQLTPSVCFYDATGKSKACGLQAISPLLSQLGFTDYWLSLHLHFNLFVKNGQLDLKRLQTYDDRSYFTAVVPGHSTWAANQVLSWVDRNVSPENYANCSQVYKNLSAQNEKPEAYLFNECLAPLQRDYNEVYGDNFSEHLTEKFKQDLLTLADFKKALQDHPDVPFYLYSGAKDPYVPKEDFAEELTEVGSLVRYTEFLGTGHDGFYTEPQVWDDLTSN